MKIVGDVLIIETSDPDELRREVNVRSAMNPSQYRAQRDT
jgi:hypothetical protein